MKEVLCVLVIFVTTIRTQTSCTIDNIEISIDTSGLHVVASWTYVSNCANIVYLVTHTIDGENVHSSGPLSVREINLEKRICSTNNVTVTVRSQAGIIKAASNIFVVGQNNLGPVQDLAFRNGRFEWNPPINTASCTVYYDIVLQNDIGPVTDRVDANYFNFLIRPCLNEIAVTPVVLEVTGPTERTEHMAIPDDLGPVQDLAFRNGRFEWNPPINTASCTVYYDIVLQNDIGPVTDRVDTNYFNFLIRPCLNEIAVTPVVLEVTGPTERTEHMAIPDDLGPVQDLAFRNGRFEWNPPINTASCTVYYDIILQNDIGPVTDRVDTNYFNFLIRPCLNEIAVTPVVLEVTGPTERTEHMAIPDDLGPVQDLAFRNGRFEWNPPINTASCDVYYDIVLQNDMGPVTERIEANYFTFPIRPCLNEIAVTPVVLDVAGPTERTEHMTIPDDVGHVRELLFNNDRFEWKRPDNTLRCPVIYEVRFQNALEEVVREIELEYFVFDLHPCTLNNIEVIPIVLTIRGEPRQLSHTVPPQMNAPVHVSTEPNTSEAVAVWRLDRPTGNVCEIRGFVARVSSTTTDGTFDVESKTGSVTISNLIERGRYTYSTWWILDDGVPSESSLDVTFLAEPLSPPDITVESITANGFIISWEQNIDTEFIQGYRVVITPNGPLHFLPEGCDQDENVISDDINDNSENQYEFLDGRPSFSYTLELFTIFTVGLERSAAETIETLETDPDKLTISSQMEYENDVRYVASANIVWPVPCNVNGFIQNFTYKITGNMNFADRENCQMIELNGVVTEMDYENTYSIRVNDLIPFLRYTVDVTTNLRDHSSVTRKTFDPPAIYTPPIA